MAVAGFSVGELTALIFTGAITFSEGISLVKIRGEAMQVSVLHVCYLYKELGTRQSFSFVTT